MAKSKKTTERDLVDRLRAVGLRKPMAKKIAKATTNVKGQLPDSARSALKEMLAKVDDLGVGGSKKRKPAEDAEGQDAAKSKTTAGKQSKKAAKKQKAKKARKKAAKKLA